MVENRFKLDTRLAADTYLLGAFPLCQLLLMDDASYPWFILVPQRSGITEIYQLSAEDQHQLLKESSYLAGRLAALFEADKLNVAALGNVVPQLHLHHIVRYCGDPAWPGPVWGHAPARAYQPSELEILKSRLLPQLQAGFTIL